MVDPRTVRLVLSRTDARIYDVLANNFAVMPAQYIKDAGVDGIVKKPIHPVLQHTQVTNRRPFHAMDLPQVNHGGDWMRRGVSSVCRIQRLPRRVTKRRSHADSRVWLHGWRGG